MVQASLALMEQVNNKGGVRNQFSAEERLSKDQKTGNQFCTEVSVDKWKSTSA